MLIRGKIVLEAGSTVAAGNNHPVENSLKLHYRMLDNLLIRRALVTEQEELEGLQLRASLTNAGDRDALLAHPDAIELPARQIAAGGVLVAVWEGAIVGFAAVEPRADGESELDALFVDPNMRRRGIGRLLIDHSAGLARTRGSASLYVVGNRHAEEFYAVCGFRVIGSAETRFGTALLMRKMVGPPGGCLGNP